MKLNVYNKYLITRRTMVQCVYQNFFNKYSQLEDIYKNCDEFLMIYDDFFFESLMQKILDNNENIVINNNVSYCAKSIIITAYYDIKSNFQEKKIAFNEYLEIAKKFCFNEKKAINKILHDMLVID